MRKAMIVLGMGLVVCCVLVGCKKKSNKEEKEEKIETLVEKLGEAKTEKEAERIANKIEQLEKEIEKGQTKEIVIKLGEPFTFWQYGYDLQQGSQKQSELRVTFKDPVVDKYFPSLRNTSAKRSFLTPKADQGKVYFRIVAKVENLGPRACGFSSETELKVDKGYIYSLGGGNMEASLEGALPQPIGRVEPGKTGWMLLTCQIPEDTKPVEISGKLGEAFPGASNYTKFRMKLTQVKKAAAEMEKQVNSSTRQISKERVSGVSGFTDAGMEQTKSAPQLSEEKGVITQSPQKQQRITTASNAKMSQEGSVAGKTKSQVPGNYISSEHGGFGGVFIFKPNGTVTQILMGTWDDCFRWKEKISGIQSNSTITENSFTDDDLYEATLYKANKSYPLLTKKVQDYPARTTPERSGIHTRRRRRQIGEEEKEEKIQWKEITLWNKYVSKDEKVTLEIKPNKTFFLTVREIFTWRINNGVLEFFSDETSYKRNGEEVQVSERKRVKATGKIDGNCLVFNAPNRSKSFRLVRQDDDILETLKQELIAEAAAKSNSNMDKTETQPQPSRPRREVRPARKTKEDLVGELEQLKKTITDKIFTDVDITSQCFTLVKEFSQEKYFADLLRPGLRVIQNTLSVFAKIKNPSSLSERIVQSIEASEYPCEIISTAMMLNGLKESGQQLRYAIDGPAYTGNVERMLEAADKTTVVSGGPGFGFSSKHYKMMIKSCLEGDFSEHKTPLVIARTSRLAFSTQSDRGALALQKTISREFRDVIEQIENNELPSDFPIEKTVQQLEDLRKQIIKSGAGATKISYSIYGPAGIETTQTASLGSIAEMNKVFGATAEAVADDLKLEIVAELSSYGSTAGDVMCLLSYKIPGGRLEEAGRVTQSASLGPKIVVNARKSFRVDAEDQFYQLPQEMVFSLPLEFSNLWRICDDTVYSLKTQIGQKHVQKDKPQEEQKTYEIQDKAKDIIEKTATEAVKGVFEKLF